MELLHKFQKLDTLQSDLEKGTFEGYASTYGNVDFDKDIIVAGAFDKTCRERPIIKLLKNHNWDWVIGIGEIRTDNKGLYLKGQLNLEVELARETRSLMLQGALDSMSIGFGVPEREKNLEYQADGTRLIKECSVKETSIVTFPSNEEAVILSIKTALKFKDNIRDFEAFLRESGFSRQQAVMIASKGFKAIQSDSEEVETCPKEISLKFLESLNRTLNTK
jgi:HK97 family phage prohead protease